MAFSRLFPLVTLCLFVALVGCSSNDDKPKLEQEEAVEVLYNRAADALDQGQNRQATQLFEEVERQHPYSIWATRAQLMAAYASYLDQRYDEAILSLDRFIELHPGNDKVDYAHYLKALSLYEQITDVSRDQQTTEDAFIALETLMRRFPNSEYTRDARLKRDLTLDHLAGKEMEIGRYYLKKKQVNAAINRFLVVVKNYQTTTHVAEALHRLVEAYLTLGIEDEAVRVAAVLGYNYPGSKWYERSYALLDEEQRKDILNSRGFIDRTLDSLLRPE